ncbi:LuxR C-terminal-related transcriptional regulator [Algoriphagus boritolerans]|uniref:LuxR C-terminal-related transcriptional regulator n=1 Tax=Algoriphagus boritolerans TaxID=308111 RepID=UPI002FCDFE38
MLREYSRCSVMRHLAEKLFLIELTVNTHRRKIMQKLEMKNSAQLVAYIEKNQITGHQLK